MQLVANIYRIFSLFLALSLSISLGTFAEEAQKESLSLETITPSSLNNKTPTWGLLTSINHLSVQDPLQNFNVSTLRTQFFSEKVLSETSKISLRGQIQLENKMPHNPSRSFHSRKTSGIFIDDARWSWTPASLRNGEFRSGFLSQEQYLSPLIIKDRAFPALRQSFSFSPSPSYFSTLSFQQAIPTNYVFSTEQEKKEALPTYLSSSLLLGYQFPFGTQIRGIASIYQWNQLPTKVAQESALSGNTLASTTTPTFAYDFLGADFYGDIIFFLPHDWKIQLTTGFIENFKAPSDKSSGSHHQLLFQKNLKSTYSLGWGFEYFYKKSDVTPAYFSPFFYENNRRGMGTHLEFGFLKTQNFLQFHWNQSQQLSQNSSKNAEDIFMFSFEKRTGFD
ncbi:MAG: hypothetical protein KDD34_01915 [Bdellovibrionales bacterium]|nr:hypothetical protein [Bdellovibrionales bacterium]